MFFFYGGDYRFGFYVLSEIDYLISVIFQHRARYVFAYVVYVAFYGGKHYLAFVSRGGGHAFFNFVEAFFRTVGGGKQGWQKKHALFVIVADFSESGNKPFVYEVERTYARIEQCRRFGSRAVQPFVYRAFEGFRRRAVGPERARIEFSSIFRNG